jgi:hypothetical protein
VFALYYDQGEAPRSSRNFRFAVLAGAHHLKEKARCDLSKWHCASDAAWGYNGRASWQKSDKESAYVWSDPKNGYPLKMKFRGSDGQFVEYVDTRPGAMVVYRELILRLANNAGNK